MVTDDRVPVIDHVIMSQQSVQRQKKVITESISCSRKNTPESRPTRRPWVISIATRSDDICDACLDRESGLS